jgi:group I intron endonuclease
MENVIYKISDHKGRIYIGSSVNFRKRKNAHLLALKKGLHSSKKLQSVFWKYGISVLTFEIVEQVESSSLLIEREQFYIDSLKPWFNICQTAGSPLGVRHSDETKRKHSLNRIGKPIHDDAFKERLAERNKKPMSDETKRKISESKKGTICTEDHRLKIGIASRGRKFTEIHKYRIGQANKGRTAPESSKKAVSEANKKRIWSDESIRKRTETFKLNRLKK